jgi:hypothetical protein
MRVNSCNKKGLAFLLRRRTLSSLRAHFLENLVIFRHVLRECVAQVLCEGCLKALLFAIFFFVGAKKKE